jgi:hypothetical protein
MTQADTAVLAGLVSLLVVLITQRSSARIAASTRSWDRRADLYMEVIRWLEQDVEALRAREPYRAQPLATEVELGLHALGSEALDKRLRRYDSARRRAVRNLESTWRMARLFLGMRLIHLQIRAELGSPLAVWDRVGFAVLGSPVFALLLATVVSPFVRRRWTAQAPVLVPEDPAGR